MEPPPSPGREERRLQRLCECNPDAARRWVSQSVRDNLEQSTPSTSTSVPHDQEEGRYHGGAQENENKECGSLDTRAARDAPLPAWASHGEGPQREKKLLNTSLSRTRAWKRQRTEATSQVRSIHTVCNMNTATPPGHHPHLTPSRLALSRLPCLLRAERRER